MWIFTVQLVTYLTHKLHQTHKKIKSILNAAWVQFVKHENGLKTIVYILKIYSHDFWNPWSVEPKISNKVLLLVLKGITYTWKGKLKQL